MLFCPHASSFEAIFFQQMTFASLIGCRLNWLAVGCLPQLRCDEGANGCRAGTSGPVQMNSRGSRSRRLDIRAPFLSKLHRWDSTVMFTPFHADDIHPNCTPQMSFPLSLHWGRTPQLFASKTSKISFRGSILWGNGHVWWQCTLSGMAWIQLFVAVQ